MCAMRASCSWQSAVRTSTTAELHTKGLMCVADCGALCPADNDMFGIITLEEYLDILINAKRVVGKPVPTRHDSTRLC